MITIDTVHKHDRFAGSVDAANFSIGKVEYQDNINKENLPEKERTKITRVAYVIGAVNIYQGWEDDILGIEFDTPEEALAVYSDILAAEKRGDKVYAFRKEGEGLGAVDDDEVEGQALPENPEDAVPEIK